MSLESVKKILKRKEGIRVEFKESRIDLPANLFETICAMLNRKGGDILLGVANDGTIKGIDPVRLDIIKNNLVTLSNNPNKLDPPFILFPKVYEIKESFIIHLQVPESSQLHRSASIVYDRSSDGDFKVSQPQLIAVHRFIRDYSGSNSPQFIEGNIFKMVLPINEGLKSLFEAIRSNPGIKAKDLVSRLDNRSIKTIERQIKELVIKEYIERRGSKKTGGYYAI